MVGKATVDLRKKVGMVVERGQHGEVAVEAGNHGGDGDGVEGEGAVAEMAMVGEIRRRGRRGKYSSRESWVDAACII